MTNRQTAAAKAKSLLDLRPLVFDTETTGLNNYAEIVELAVVEWTGVPVFNKILRPSGPVEPEAAAIHRISDAEIGAAPSIADVLPVLRGLFDGRVVVSYNLDFDRRLLRQSLSAQGLGWPEQWTRAMTDNRCVMELFAEWYGEIGPYGYRSKKQVEALSIAGLPAEGLHRAMADARAALLLLKWMAGSSKDASRSHEWEEMVDELRLR